MFTIYADNQILHNPRFADNGMIVINPVLHERLNTTGSLEFGIAPNNPLYGKLEPRKTMVRVVSDAKNGRIWFGRVMETEAGWNNVVNVHCDGELICLNDSVFRPFGFKGSPEALLRLLVTTYNDSLTDGFAFSVGNVSVTDPNNTIVRSSMYAATVLKAIKDELVDSSLGGYILPRYDKSTDTHYIDYLTLDANDQYARESSQVIRFGENLLDFQKNIKSSDVATVLIPYGASLQPDDPDYRGDPPENGSWDGDRVTIKSVNSGNDWIENATGLSLWGRIVATKIWDDVTIPANLLTRAQTWLNEQIAQSITLQVNAIDLSYVDADIEQIQVGEFVNVQSVPHGLNLKLICSEKKTHLTELEESAIILGAGIDNISDIIAYGGAMQ